MKRRTGNVDAGKPPRRQSKRAAKFTDSVYGSSYIYFKFFMAWAFIIFADFILEFRFEYLWPLWLLIQSCFETFKCQGLVYSMFFVCIAITSDTICFLFIPIQWLFFMASTYVWIHYVWHTEKGLCLPTALLWFVFMYVEATLRLKDLHNNPFHIELCRPFAAHCIGHPFVTLGIGFKSYISYRLRIRTQRHVQKENTFYYELLKGSLPAPPTIQQRTTATNHTLAIADKEKGEVHVSNGGLHISSSSGKKGSDKRNHNHKEDTQASDNSLTSTTTALSSLRSASSPTSKHQNGKSGKSSGGGKHHRRHQNNNHQQQQHNNNNTTTTADDNNTVTSSCVSSSSNNKKKNNWRRSASQSSSSSDLHSSSTGGSRSNKSSSPKSSKQNNNNHHHHVAVAATNNHAATNGDVVSVAAAPVVAAATQRRSTNHKDTSSSPSSTSPTSLTSVMAPSLPSPCNIAAASRPLSNGRVLTAAVAAAAPTTVVNSKSQVGSKVELVSTPSLIEQLETTINKLSAELCQLRKSELESRTRIEVVNGLEKSARSELKKLKEEHESLQTKYQNLCSGKQKDKLNMQCVEKKLKVESENRSNAEKLLQDEMRRHKEEEKSAKNAAAAVSSKEKEECEQLRHHKIQLEEQLKSMHNTLKKREESYSMLKKSITQREKSMKESETLMSALEAMQEKNQMLEKSLSAETKIKLDLFSALGETKHQVEIASRMMHKRDNEISDLKSRMTDMVSVMPNSCVRPSTPHYSTSFLEKPPPPPSQIVRVGPTQADYANTFCHPQSRQQPQQQLQQQQQQQLQHQQLHNMHQQMGQIDQSGMHLHPIHLDPNALLYAPTTSTH